MQPVTFKRHRCPPDVIRVAVWLNFRFTLSFRDVEEMLAQRGIEASYETIRCWTQNCTQITLAFREFIPGRDRENRASSSISDRSGVCGCP
jgi:transposase-like protein